MSRRAMKRQNTRSVSLRSGGTVTVSFDFSVFDLTGTDRDFVNHLTDMIRDYESANAERSKAERSKAERSKAERTPTKRAGSPPSPGEDGPEVRS